ARPRAGLPIRPRGRGRVRGPGLPGSGQDVLRADRPRLRGGDRRAPGRMETAEAGGGGRMTEAEWLSYGRPGNLVRFVVRKKHSRKLTLLMAAQFGPLLATPRLQSFSQLVKDRIEQEETPGARELVRLPQCPQEVGTYNGPLDSRLAYLGYC